MINDRSIDVVLVDEDDTERGIAGKLDAHRHGLLHRACSVFVFDDVGRLLLQRRAADKYHSGGLWSNTCCGHPLPGETPDAAAHRRLRQEMGFDCALTRCFAFVYCAALEGGLVEHEYDHVFIGWFEGDPRPDAREVTEWRWEPLDAVCHDVVVHPERYTAWLPAALNRIELYAAEEVTV